MRARTIAALPAVPLAGAPNGKTRGNPSLSRITTQILSEKQKVFYSSSCAAKQVDGFGWAYPNNGDIVGSMRAIEGRQRRNHGRHRSGAQSRGRQLSRLDVGRL